MPVARHAAPDGADVSRPPARDVHREHPVRVLAGGTVRPAICDLIPDLIGQHWRDSVNVTVTAESRGIR